MPYNIRETLILGLIFQYEPAWLVGILVGKFTVASCTLDHCAYTNVEIRPFQFKYFFFF